MMVNSDGAHVGGVESERKKEIKSRQRASTSCTECKRRKQKCNQAKDRPCNNCSRRYPPVPCVYEILRQVSKYKESIVKLDEVPEARDEESDQRHELMTLHEGTNVRSNVPSPAFGLRHPAFQLSLRPSSAVTWEGHRSESKDHTPRNSRTSTHPQVWDISPAFHDGLFHAYPDPPQTQYSCSRISSRGVALDPLLSLPIEHSRRNAELFHFFLQKLSPFMCSIDGNNPSQAFMTQWLPFMTQSPIAIYITILTASYFQAVSRQVEVQDSVDAMASKGRLISMINAHIATHSMGMNDESIGAVMSLAYNEFVYSDEKSTLAHMRGLREMIKTRGGVQNIGFPLLRKLLLRTDFQIAMSLEIPLFLHAKELFLPLKPIINYSIYLDCPFLLSSWRFIDNIQIHNIALETATLLDDVRWLITSIIHLSQSSHSPTSPEHLKFIATAQWIHTRLLSSAPTLSRSPPTRNVPSSSSNHKPQLPAPRPPHHQPLHTTVHHTTLILLSSILNPTPLSQTLLNAPDILTIIWRNMWQAPLSIWKLHPGIFFYILVVVNPGARKRPEGRFLKGMLAVTAVAIGTAQACEGGEGNEEGSDGWEVLKGIVGCVMVVQRWLEDYINHVTK